MEVTVIVCTSDGIIYGELTRELDVGDLGEVNRLIASTPVAVHSKSVSAAPPAAIKATHH